MRPGAHAWSLGRLPVNAPKLLRAGAAVFFALSLADLAVTYALLRASPGEFHEGNPVARWWLDRWGWAGLACFKAVVVLLVLATAGAVARRRRRAATGILAFACGATALVVAYGCTLAATARNLPDLAALAERG